MRGAGALAATALMVLALGAAGCKPSSLTPFGIDERQPETAASNTNGTWTGTTGNGGNVRFVVGNSMIDTFLLEHSAGTCSATFESAGGEEPITDGYFTLEVDLDQGRIVYNGHFTSNTTCTGTYDFEGLPVVTGCPTADSGSFTASKSAQ